MKAERELGEHISWGNKGINERDLAQVALKDLLALIDNESKTQSRVRDLLDSGLVAKARAAAKGEG